MSRIVKILPLASLMKPITSKLCIELLRSDFTGVPNGPKEVSQLLAYSMPNKFHDRIQGCLITSLCPSEHYIILLNLHRFPVWTNRVHVVLMHSQLCCILQS